MNTSVEKLLTKLQDEEDVIQKARIIHILHVERMVSLKEISTYIKKHPSYVSLYLRVLQLPAMVLDGYYARQISSAHLFILSRLKNREDMLKAYEEILIKGLTSNQAEELVREIKFTVSTTPGKISKKEVDELIEDIQHVFPGTKVKIIQNRIRAKLTLELKGNSDDTTHFIKQVGGRLSKKGYAEAAYDDTLQVLE